MDDGIFGTDGLLDDLTTIVSTAAAAILTTRAGSLDPRTKADQSPVTAADEAAEAVILAGLARVLPAVPVVSEEAAGRAPSARLGDRFILVDPLDGTRELLAGRDEFTINVALVDGGRPTLGIVAAPAMGLLWRGRESRGAERLRLPPGSPASDALERVPVRTRPCPADGVIATVSRSHLDKTTEAFLARLPVGSTVNCGSAIKFCQVAEGAADIYPRFGTTCEWDIAAGHAVLAAAGGSVTSPSGGPLEYGRIDKLFRVASFIAWGDRSAVARFSQVRG